MNRGYVKLWRKSQDEAIFQNARLWRFWTWCLMRATHREEFFPVKTGGESEKIVKLEPGQFIFGRRSAAKVLKEKPSTIRNWLGFLEKGRYLDTLKGPHYTIVTICKWDTLQANRKKEDTLKGPPEDHRRTHPPSPPLPPTINTEEEKNARARELEYPEADLTLNPGD